MIASDAYPIQYKGKPARLRVIRNDGFCWGRIVTADGVELDVNTRRDQYERCDDDAAASFTRAAQRGNVEPAVGWLGCA